MNHAQKNARIKELEGELSAWGGFAQMLERDISLAGVKIEGSLGHRAFMLVESWLWNQEYMAIIERVLARKINRDAKKDAMDAMTTLDFIDYYNAFKVTKQFRADHENTGGMDVEHNTRQMALRVIRHLIRLKNEIRYRHDMNYDVGSSSLEYIAGKYGVDLCHYSKTGKTAGELLPMIDQDIETFRQAMGYTKEDIDALKWVYE